MSDQRFDRWLDAAGLVDIQFDAMVRGFFDILSCNSRALDMVKHPGGAARCSVRTESLLSVPDMLHTYLGWASSIVVVVETGCSAQP